MLVGRISLATVSLAVAACGRVWFEPLDDAASEDGDASLLLWIRGEDDPADGALDSSRYGRHARCGNACPTHVAGRVGMAYQFAEAAQTMLEVPSDAVLETHGSYTFTAWINAGSLNNRAVVGKPVGGSTLNSWKLYLTNGLLAFETTTGSAGQLDIAPPFGTGEWAHVAATWDGTNRVLYANGSQIAADVETAFQYDASPVTIGADINNASQIQHFIGIIDEVRVYARVLTAPEIAALAQ